MKGEKTGGRQKGTPNKRTEALQNGLQEMVEGGKDPYSALFDLAMKDDTPLDQKTGILFRLMKYTYRELTAEGGEGSNATDPTTIVAIQLQGQQRVRE